MDEDSDKEDNLNMVHLMYNRPNDQETIDNDDEIEM